MRVNEQSKKTEFIPFQLRLKPIKARPDTPVTLSLPIVNVHDNRLLYEHQPTRVFNRFILLRKNTVRRYMSV